MKANFAFFNKKKCYTERLLIGWIADQSVESALLWFYLSRYKNLFNSFFGLATFVALDSRCDLFVFFGSYNTDDEP